MKKYLLKNSLPLFLTVTLLLSSASYFFISPKEASAATLTGTYVRLDRIKAGQTTGGTVCAKPGATATIIDVQVAFAGNGTQGAASFGVNTTAANWTTTTSNLPSGASAWPNITTASAVSGATVTFNMTPGSSMTSGTLYCFNFAGTSTLTNPSSAGNSLTGTIQTRISGPTNQDSTSYAISIISEDQITVSATVPQIFTLSLSGTSVNHGTLTAGTVDTGSITATMGTNGDSGWVAWIKSDNAYLNSTTTGGQITTPGSVDDATSDLSSSTYGWILDAIPTQDTDGTGTVSQVAGYGAEYDGGDTCSSSTTGGTLSTAFQPIAASNGTSDNEQIELCSLVRITAFQEAASDYTATLTFTAAGRF